MNTDWKFSNVLTAEGISPPGFAPVSDQMLEVIVSRIVTGVQPDKIILFGSYAYGRPTPDSDLDLLVIMETDKRPADRVVVVSRFLRPRPCPMDILVRTPEEVASALEKREHFIQTIMQRGKVLYERRD
ncbi:MAG: nucleotidyltransferase domain-containing protein [Anaerolineaceae bacterium]|nr:nucleotidyltransferase domain-containing protein [Anaerolineaceae bacterium]